MALKTDDCDVKQTHLLTRLGGNGDFYIIIYDEEKNSSSSVRIATSGGFAPVEVKTAIANLWRAMEVAGLNKWPN